MRKTKWVISLISAFIVFLVIMTVLSIRGETNVQSLNNFPAEPARTDFYMRLNQGGIPLWTIKNSGTKTEITGLIETYQSSKAQDNINCKVYIFDDYDSAQFAIKRSALENLGEISTFRDSETDYEIIATSRDLTSECMEALFYTINGYSSDVLENTSDTAELGGLFTEAKLREAILENGTNLPSRFGSMKFQEGVVVYDAYGVPWTTFALGATSFAVKDYSKESHISGYGQASTESLISWECDTTFNVIK